MPWPRASEAAGGRRRRTEGKAHEDQACLSPAPLLLRRRASASLLLRLNILRARQRAAHMCCLWDARRGERAPARVWVLRAGEKEAAELGLQDARASLVLHLSLSLSLLLCAGCLRGGGAPGRRGGCPGCDCGRRSCSPAAGRSRNRDREEGGTSAFAKVRGIGRRPWAWRGERLVARRPRGGAAAARSRRRRGGRCEAGARGGRGRAALGRAKAGGGQSRLTCDDVWASGCFGA